METVNQGNVTSATTGTGTITTTPSTVPISGLPLKVDAVPLEQPKTFTQADVDRIVQERLKRDRGERADYDELKEKAAKYDEISGQTNAEIEKLRKELDEYKTAESIRQIRAKVAAEMEIPENLLTGNTEEDCKAQASAIKAYARPAYPSVRDGGEPQNTQGQSTRQQFADWLNAQK